jgi:hypothetical protein
MPIYLKGEDEETLARLRDLGFDAQIVSDDPMGDLIFYTARINAKLDNLGQLRHLHKMMQSTTKMKVAAEEEQKYYARLNWEYEVKQARLKTIYNKMKEFTNVPENDPWRKNLPTFATLAPREEADVFRVFQCEADSQYFLYAIEPSVVYFKGIVGESTLLNTKAENGPSVRILDL